MLIRSTSAHIRFSVIARAAFLSPAVPRTFLAVPSLPPVNRLQTKRFRPKPPPIATALPPAITLLAITAASTNRAILGTLRGPPAAFLASALLTNLSLLPASAPIYATMMDIAPAAVCLLLLQPLYSQSARTSRKDTRNLLVAFAVGAIGTTMGAILGALLCASSKILSWQVAAAFAATYIGGSVNYIGIVKALNIPAETAAAGLTADLALMALYFGALFALAARQGVELDKRARAPTHVSFIDGQRQSYRVLPLLLPIALTAGITAGSRVIARAFRLPPGFDLLLMASGSLLLSNVPQLKEQLKSSSTIGNMAVAVFFAALGATTRLSAVVGASKVVVTMACVVLLVHAMTMYVVGKRVLRLPTKTLLLASNANVGGASTAAAFAAAFGWRMLIPGAVVVGTLGYLIGTPVGLAIFAAAQRMTLIVPL